MVGQLSVPIDRRTPQDVAHGGGSQEDAQGPQCERNAASPPLGVGRGNLPYQPHQRFRGPVDGGSTSLTTEPNAVLESAQPATHGGASYPEALWNLAARDTLVLHTPQDVQAFCHGIGTPDPSGLQSTLQNGNRVGLQLDDVALLQILCEQFSGFSSGVLRLLTT